MDKIGGAGILLVITGPTGSGKDELIKKLLVFYPRMKRVVTHTSRPPRPQETPGVDYYFVSRQQFEQMLNKEELIEYIELAGNYYGTSKAEIAKILSGQDLVWRIDPTRAAQIEEFFQEHFSKKEVKVLVSKTLVVAVTVPNVQTIYRRLKARGDYQQNRIEHDWQLWQKLHPKFKHIVVNLDGALEQTVSMVVRMLEDFKKSTLS